MPRNKLIYIAVTGEAQESLSFEISQSCGISESIVVKKKSATIDNKDNFLAQTEGSNFPDFKQRLENPVSYLFVNVHEIQLN